MCIGQDVKAQHPHDTQGAPGDVPGVTVEAGGAWKASRCCRRTL